MTQTDFETQLTQLWESNAREFALRFFRQAIHPQLLLSELEAALNYEAAKGQLECIKLGEILDVPAAPKAAPAAAAPAAAPERPQGRPPAAVAKAPKRARQSTEKMQHVVLRALQEERDGLSTPKISQAIASEISGADPARTIAILRHLEQGGQVVGDRSRPRIWQLKNPGRRVPEPIVIRKAAVVEAESEARSEPMGPAVPAASLSPVGAAPATGAVNGDAPATLLSQAEIQRAAAQLHDRFFAGHKRS